MIVGKCLYWSYSTSYEYLNVISVKIQFPLGWCFLVSFFFSSFFTIEVKNKSTEKFIFDLALS